MPVVPTAPTISSGVVTSSQFNQFRDAIAFTQAPPRAKLVQRTLQAIANVTFVAITFGAELLDTDVDGASGHDNSTNPSRWTASYPGWYQLSGAITFDVSSTGARYAMLRVNGVDQESSLGSIPGHASLAATVQCHTTKVYLTTGDYVELVGYQNTGGSLNTFVGSDYARSAMDVLWVSR